MMDYFYHLMPGAQWAQLRESKEYVASSLKSEGFMHMSTAAQLPKTAKRFYAGQSDIVALKIDPAKLKSEVKFEPAHGELFPHLFGPLNLDAVVEVVTVET